MKSEKVLLTGRGKDQYETVITELNNLNLSASGPFRLEKKIDQEKKCWIKYVRERTWFEFFYESLVATPQEKKQREQEVVDALEHAFRPIICAARRAAYQQAREYENKSCDGELIDAPLDYSRNMDDADDQMPSSQKLVSRKELLGEAPPPKYVDMLEDLLILFANKALGIAKPIDEAARRSHPFQLSRASGSSDRFEHFFLTKRPALEFYANNVIVGSVTALAVKKAEASATLRRALSAFKEVWRDAKSSCLLPGPDPEKHVLNGRGLKRVSILVPHAIFPVVNGLEHIENLVCIKDDVGRDYACRFKDFGKEDWKKFYLEGCGKMRGSVVRELYPSYYVTDEENGKKITPYYSDANVQGAIEAAFELSSLSREDGEDPVSFMFAGLNEDAYGRILEKINMLSNREQIARKKLATEKRSSLPKLPGDVPTPDRKARQIEKEKESNNGQFQKQKDSSSLLIGDDEDCDSNALSSVQ